MDTITINPNRIDLDEAYMQMAEVWAKRSKANRKQVGALIVKEGRIISDGYNGMPAGDPDDTCEEWVWPDGYDGVDGVGGPPDKVLRTKAEVLHAESNALLKVTAQGGVGAKGATLYVTMSPCKECAKLIKQAGIQRVVYREQYRETSGVDFLRSRGVKVEQLGQAQAKVEPPVVNLPAQPSKPRLGLLAGVAGKPVPVQGPTLVQQPVVPPVQGPTIVEQPVVPKVEGPIIEDVDVNRLLAEAGVTLVNGVPVERPATKPTKPDEPSGYVSSFL